MTIFMFIILIISEIGFAVFELSKKTIKKEWSLNRLIADVTQLIISLLMVFLPGIDFSFRFKGLFIILVIRIAIAGLFAFINRHNDKLKKKASIIFSAVISTIIIFHKPYSGLRIHRL